MQPDELGNLAARHVPGKGPVDIHPLRNGLVNQTYRVLRDGAAYAMRVAATTPRDLGLDRAWEFRVLQNAVAADLAPALEYCDPRRGILIARWVDGRTWGAGDVRCISNVSRVTELMRRIHALPMPMPARAMSPRKWIEHYRSAARQAMARGPSAAAPLHSAAMSRLTALDALPAVDAVICHGDLHTLNLIDRGRSLVLIDWEYAHASDPLWDLAGWSANNDLEQEAERELLTQYTGGAPARGDYLRLRILGWLYDYVCLLWSEIYLGVQRGAGEAGGARGDVANDGIYARAMLLTARLHASK